METKTARQITYTPSDRYEGEVDVSQHFSVAGNHHVQRFLYTPEGSTYQAGAGRSIPGPHMTCYGLAMVISAYDDERVTADFELQTGDEVQVDGNTFVTTVERGYALFELI